MQQKESFEQALTRLEEITRLLEKGEAPLEESLRLFEEGTRLAAQCDQALRQAEQKMEELTAPSDTEQD